MISKEDQHSETRNTRKYLRAPLIWFSSKCHIFVYSQENLEFGRLFATSSILYCTFQITTPNTCLISQLLFCFKVLVKKTPTTQTMSTSITFRSKIMHSTAQALNARNQQWGKHFPTPCFATQRRWVWYSIMKYIYIFYMCTGWHSWYLTKKLVCLQNVAIGTWRLCSLAFVFFRIYETLLHITYLYISSWFFWYAPSQTSNHQLGNLAFVVPNPGS